MKTALNKSRNAFLLARRRQILVLIFCLISVTLSGLRNPDSEIIGVDTPTYRYTYNELERTSWYDLINNFSYYSVEYEGREKGYDFFVKFTQIFIDNFRFFMFLTAAFFIIPVGMIIYRYVKSYEGLILSFTIYFALFTSIPNGLMRQAITLGVFLLATKYVETREWIKFYVIIALLFTIHNSIVIAIPFFFMYKHCTSKKYLLIALIAAPVLVAVSSTLMYRILAGTVYELYGESDGFGLVNILLLIGAISLLTYFYFDKVKKIEGSNFLICGVIGTLFCLPFIRLGGTVLRISYYYFVFFIPLLPVLIDCACKDRVIRWLAYLFSISFFLFFIFR